MKVSISKHIDQMEIVRPFVRSAISAVMPVPYVFALNVTLVITEVF